MKYFFLTEGWTVGRVWGFGGLWNELAWRRQPDITRLNLYIDDQAERLWLYEVEDDVLMLEVKPLAADAESTSSQQNLGQVVLKRLLSAEQVIHRLCESEAIAAVTTAESISVDTR